jgi:apolipoprotein N-acyltransferase
MEEVIHKSSGSAGQDTPSSRSMSKDVTDLVDTYIALAKANVTEKAANAASASVAGVLIAVLGFFFIFFAGFALGWWIGQLISSIVGGFLIVAGLFGVAGALLIAFKEQLIYRVIRNKVVKKIYE